MSERNDPFESYNFIVELDGATITGFTEVSGLESRIEVIEFREGADTVFPVRKLPGKVSYTNIVLKTGITEDSSLYDWHREWVQREDSARRKLIRVVLLDGAGRERRSWKVREAWPAAYIGPTFNAATPAVAIQTFEIAHEGIDLE